MRKMFGLVPAILLASAGAAAANGVVNVYSYRQPELVKPLFDRFTAETGTTVNVVFAEKGMVERLRAEGPLSPADVVLTVDIARLTEVVDAGVTQAVDDPQINGNIPAQYRDPAGQWFGLTTRTRAVYVNPQKMDPAEITSYADLADPKYKGRICIRSGKHDYNIGLIASIIAHDGVEKAEEWVKGLKANLARKPGGNDRAQIKGAAAGECDIGIANSYYYGVMLSDPEQRAQAEAVKIVFPDGGYGAHINVSGMAMTAAAPNRDNALALMRFLASDEAQAIYAEANFEYPVKDGVAWSDLVKSWGSSTADTLPLTEVAKHRAEAVRIIDRTGFEDGPSS